MLYRRVFIDQIYDRVRVYVCVVYCAGTQHEKWSKLRHISATCATIYIFYAAYSKLDFDLVYLVVYNITYGNPLRPNRPDNLLNRCTVVLSGYKTKFYCI